MQLDAIGIISKNVYESIRFYELFGINFIASGSPDHWEGLSQNGMRIMLDSENLIKKINPSWEKPIGSGIVLCFKQESSNEVNFLYSKIIKKGFKSIKEPWNAFWGQRYCSVQDPNNNQIDIFSPLTNEL